MTQLNPFSDSGEEYARHRPSYPPVLVQALAELCSDRSHAADIGCGTGQLSVPLADAFEKVTAIDPSKSQLANARGHPRIQYRLGTAERIELPDNSVDLAVAAQAAHWFDLGQFYREAQRILRPRSVLALVTYGVPVLDGPAGSRFDQFYWQDIHQFWPHERRHVENRYQTLHFPFEESALPALTIVRDWSFEELSAYIGTWSATRAARAAGESNIVNSALSEIAKAWGDGEIEHRITWPVFGRLAVMRERWV
jgi:ubiquinone/menaquinone biosynthesis C-methylase UbiE